MQTRWLVALISSGITMLVFANSFQSTDTDHDGRITEYEFYNFAINTGLFSKWDTNDDALIGENEYIDAGLEGDFASWDFNGDSYLNANELYDGTFGMFDENENGYWTANEWDHAGDAGLFDV